ncbi:MAG: carotenoid biosynthesis protein [Saprospiraceae bacterium]|nr:carotenoid biosynthesis protein [Saprospiraceae bacterium]
MTLIQLKSKLSLFNLSFFTAILFHLCGLIGMGTEYRQWFIDMTPFTLILMSFLVFLNDKTPSKKAIIIYGILGFFTGLLTEMIGVNTSLLFGNYSYGPPFGFKVLGVPILIGLLWVVTVYGVGHLTNWFFNQFIIYKSDHYGFKFIKIIFAALLVTMYDFVLEPGAITLGYWYWLPDGAVPMFNYVCWFTISGFLLCPFFVIKHFYGKTNNFAALLMVIQWFFFASIKFLL